MNRESDGATRGRRPRDSDRLEREGGRRKSGQRQRQRKEGGWEGGSRRKRVMEIGMGTEAMEAAVSPRSIYRQAESEAKSGEAKRKIRGRGWR